METGHETTVESEGDNSVVDLNNPESELEIPSRKDSGHGDSLDGSFNMSDESQFTNLATETKYSIVKSRITRAKTPIEDSISVDVNEKDLKGEEDEEINSTSKLVTFNETSTFVPTVGTEEAEEANETPVELEEAVPHPSSARAVSTPASESSPRPSEITKQSEKMSPIEGSFSEDEVDEENLSITSATTAEENGESDGDDEDGSTKEDGGESDKDNDDDSEKESSNSAVNSTKNSSRGSSAKSVSGSIKSNEDENTKQSSRVSSAKSKADSNDAKIDDDQDNQSEKGADYEKENDENNKTENNSKASSTRNSSRESSAKLEKESNIANENNDDGNESEKADSDTTSNINNEDDKESRASSSKDKDDENEDDDDDVKLSGLNVNASSTKNSSRASSAKETNESQRDSENKDDVQLISGNAKDDNDDESEKNSKAENSKDSSRASSAKSNESETSKVSTRKSSLKSENEAKAEEDDDSKSELTSKSDSKSEMNLNDSSTKNSSTVSSAKSEDVNDVNKEDGLDDDKESDKNSSGNTTKASSRQSSGKSTKSDDENESDKNSSDNSTKASSRESSAKSTKIESSGSDDDASKVSTRKSSTQLENKDENKEINEDENKSDDEDGGNESDVDINDVGSISSSKKKEDIDTSLLNQDSVASSRQSSAKSNRLISRRVSVEVLSDAETSKVTDGVIDSNDSMKEDTSSNEKKEASDSGTEEKPPRKERNRVKKSKDTQFLKTALISAAPTIAAGGTVFATASRRKIPAHLKNVKSVIAKTFHENETYNSNGDSGVEGSTTSGDSPKNFDTPRKLNALDKRKLPRSKSVPRPPFSLITSKASNESNKRVPMNKIVLQPKHPKINLKKVKPRISTLENANYKPGGGQVKISVKKLEWKAVSRTNATNEKYDEAKQKDDSKPKRKKHNYSIGPGAMKNTREINKRVAEKRSKYQRAWAAHPVPNGKNGSTVDNGETIEQENKTDDEEEGKASIDEQKEEKDLEVGSGQADEAKDENDDEDNDTAPSAPPAEELEPEPVSNKTSDGETSNSIKLEKNAIELLINGKTINLDIPSKYQSNYNIDEVIAAPAVTPNLEWVYGYRGKDTRGNLFSLPTGEIIYYVARLVILYNPESQTQRHYQGHTEDIECLAVHPQLTLCATGQPASSDDDDENSAHIQVWNYETLELVHILGNGELSSKVSCVSFSILDDSGNSKLVVVDGADQPNISVWTNFDKKQISPKLITQSTASSDKVLSVKFYDKRHNILVTCGKTHLNIWSMEGDILMRRQGLFTKKIQKPKYVIVTAFANSGEIISGDSDGNVMVWRSIKVVRVLKGAHTGPVSDICVFEDGSFVSGGVSDGALVVFDSNYDLIGVGATLPEQFGGVRRIIKKDFSVEDGTRKYHLYVGTTTNSIVEVLFKVSSSSTDVTDLEVDRLVLGHYEDVWALATHPTSSKFISCGHDGNVICWDAIAHTDLWVVQLNGKAQCVAISPDGLAYAVGTLGGVLHVGKMETKEHVIQSIGSSIETVAFSPSGEYLAVGSHDKKIHVFKFEKEEYEDHVLISECVGHKTMVKYLDWSSNSLYMRSNSEDLQLLYWNPVTGDKVTDMDLLDNLDWVSQNCPMTFESIAIWNQSEGSNDINGTSKSKKLLAACDENGKIRLFTFPAIHQKQDSKTILGHSAHVTAVEFFDDQNKLVSVGGREPSILLWQI